MTKQNSRKNDDELSQAKRGLLIYDIATRDKIMARQVNFMPTAFMSASIHNGADALRCQFYKPATRVSPKKDDMSDAGMFALASMQQDVAIRWYHTPCHAILQDAHHHHHPHPH